MPPPSLPATLAALVERAALEDHVEDRIAGAFAAARRTEISEQVFLAQAREDVRGAGEDHVLLIDALCDLAAAYRWAERR